MSTRGGPVFRFSLPGGAARPLDPPSVPPLLLLNFNREKQGYNQVRLKCRSNESAVPKATLTATAAGFVYFSLPYFLDC